MYFTSAICFWRRAPLISRIRKLFTALLFTVPSFYCLAQTATAVRTLGGSIAVDGFLSEAIWAKAPSVGAFIEFDPKEGAAPSESTFVRVLYDDASLYIGAFMADSEPSKIVGALARRDELPESDWFAVAIDSYHDHKTAFLFLVNASGVQVDGLFSNDEGNPDLSWDAVWVVQVKRLPAGWSAEFRIPYSALRFYTPKNDGGDSSYTWGISFVRYISRHREMDIWPRLRKSESGFVSRFGHLLGLKEISPPLRFEALPYVLSSAEFQQPSQACPSGRLLTGNLGLDLKYGLTSNMTLDATMNPDFGQVEADPSVLNLSTYETFYPEKRPFFIEGMQIFNFRVGTMSDGASSLLFYSRRIGKPPTKSVDVPEEGELILYPASTTILGAVKVTGKTANGLALGVLDALTQAEYATVADSLGRRFQELVAPLANYGVLRVQQDILKNSTLGMMLTSAAWRGLAPAHAGGIDWNFRFADNTYSFNGQISGSRTTNGERTEGWSTNMRFGKDGGKHWIGSLNYEFFSRHYNINDLGFVRRPDYHSGILWIQYKEDEPGLWYQSYRLNFNMWTSFNLDGINLSKGTNINFNSMLGNFWSIGAGIGYNLSAYDDRESRGQGLYREPASIRQWLYVSTDSRKPIQFSLQGFHRADMWGGETFNAGLSALIKPSPSIQIELGTNFSRGYRQVAWADNVADPNDPNSTISVFARRSTETFDMTLRGSLTFTRTLSFQIYSQVFCAKGHYEDFMQLVDPDELRPYPYDGNRDFNIQALHLNAVLRWEYLPGSALYVVWTQARNGSEGSFWTPFIENVHSVFRVPADNILMVKASYWLNL